MKIGLFIPNATFDLPGSAEVGGIEVYAFELGEALQKRGHNVVLFGGKPKYGRAFRETSLRLSLHRYIETKNIWKLGTRFRKLVQRLHFATTSLLAVEAEKCDLMLIFKPYDFINTCRWKNRLPKLKVVMNYQGKDFFATDRFWRRHYIDWEYAASEENAQLALHRYGVKPEVFPNGVDTDLFKPAEKTAIPDKLTVLTAGRIVGWKGLEYLIRAVAKIPQVNLQLAGDGPQRLDLEKLAEKLGIADRVKFFGVLKPDALAEKMKQADLFAQPSIDFDACPTATLQALSSGMLTLMSDQVGLRNYFPDKISSWHIPARDVDVWAEALKAAVALPAQEGRNIGMNARIIILENFGWNGIAARLETRLLELINEQPQATLPSSV